MFVIQCHYSLPIWRGSHLHQYSQDISCDKGNVHNRWFLKTFFFNVYSLAVQKLNKIIDYGGLSGHYK